LEACFRERFRSGVFTPDPNDNEKKRDQDMEL